MHKYDRKDFTQQVRSKVNNITGRTFIIRTSPDPRYAYTLKDSEVQLAMIEIVTGGLQGSLFQIESNIGNEITLKSGYPGYPTNGETFRLFWDCTKLPAEDFTGEIVGANICQAFDQDDIIPLSGGKVVFPDGVTGCTLIRCNATNVEIPAGVTLGAGTVNETIKMTNNADDWSYELDAGTWKPARPMTGLYYDRHGISKDPADISATPLSESVLDTRQKQLRGLVNKTNKYIVMSGGAVIEDNDETSNLDVRLTGGVIFGADLTKNRIEPILSRDSLLTRHYYLNGIDTSDQHAEIDATKFTTLDGLSDTLPGKYYKSLFIATREGIHWLYPIAGYSTILAAKRSIDPPVPDSIGRYLKSSAVIMKGDDTKFPPIASGRWIDKRRTVQNILKTDTSL